MQNSQKVFFSVFALSIFCALMLSNFPQYIWLQWFRPPLVLLALIYWTINAPKRLGIVIPWILGLATDFLNDTLLGEHALAFIVVLYCVSNLAIRLRLYPLMQQTLSIFLLVLLYQLILYCIQGLIGLAPQDPRYWLVSLSSLLIWPLIWKILRKTHLHEA